MTTMKALTGLLFLLSLPGLLHAAPGEDHWSTEVDPAHAEALENATSLIEGERFAEALPILRRLSNDLPANADVFSLLGFAYRKTGNLQDSGTAYERALHLQPDHLGALEYQGELFLMKGDLAAAEANLARLERLCPLPCEETAELAEAIEAWRAEQAQ